MSDSSAKELWQQKLEHLQAQEALAVGSDEKFTIAHGIAEAKSTLAELSSLEDFLER